MLCYKSFRRVRCVHHAPLDFQPNDKGTVERCQANTHYFHLLELESVRGGGRKQARESQSEELNCEGLLIIIWKLEDERPL